MSSELFRALPAVDKLLADLEADPGLQHLPRPLVKDLVNEFLDICRQEIRQGAVSSPDQLEPARLAPRIRAHLSVRSQPKLRRVLNGTGVVVHTNLGRSVLSDEAIDAVLLAAKYYSNLEFDLDTGKRGSRYDLVTETLCRVTGAEDGMVVNNNASAVLLLLDTFAKDREVIVSRGQLVEIGGSFRIPEVMAKSGALLREVGATNRTHLRDYENAITENTAALLKVHTSNYRIIGFSKEVPLESLVALGRTRGLPVFEDLGSGNLYDFPPGGLCDEPTVQRVIKAGADVVTFSGDKVLGGPQAGVIVGKREMIAAMRKNQLNRALRPDKMTLAGLEATLRLYLEPETAVRRVPTLRLLTTPPSELDHRSEELAALLQQAGPVAEYFSVDIVPGVSRVGGGAFPEQDIPTALVRLRDTGWGSVEELRQKLLHTSPPLIGRIEDNAFLMDVRTLRDDELELVRDVIINAVSVAPA